MPAMQSSSLGKYEVLRTSDLDTAERVISDYIQPHKIKAMCHGGKDMGFGLRFAKGRKISLALAHYAIDVAIDPKEFEDFYLLQFPLSGQSTLIQSNIAAVSGPGSGWISSVHRPVQIEQRGDVTQYLIKLDSLALNASLAQLLDRNLKRPVDFQPGIATSGSAGRSLLRAIQHLALEYDAQGGEGAHPLLLAQLEETVLTALLCCQPHSFSDALNSDQQSFAPKSVRRMMEEVRARPEHEWTLLELASVAGLSPRSLQSACQRHIGQPPMAFVRSIRMERAHSALKEAGQDDSVTSIAMAWGFFQLGRFAQDYRRRFGESPSVTLRQN